MNVSHRFDSGRATPRVHDEGTLVFCIIFSRAGARGTRDLQGCSIVRVQTVQAAFYRGWATLVAVGAMGSSAGRGGPGNWVVGEGGGGRVMAKRVVVCWGGGGLVAIGCLGQTLNASGRGQTLNASGLGQTLNATGLGQTLNASGRGQT